MIARFEVVSFPRHSRR